MIELEEIQEQRFLTHLGIRQNFWTLSLEDECISTLNFNTNPEVADLHTRVPP